MIETIFGILVCCGIIDILIHLWIWGLHKEGTKFAAVMSKINLILCSVLLIGLFAVVITEWRF